MVFHYFIVVVYGKKHGQFTATLISLSRKYRFGSSALRDRERWVNSRMWSNERDRVPFIPVEKAESTRTEEAAMWGGHY